MTRRPGCVNPRTLGEKDWVLGFEVSKASATAFIYVVMCLPDILQNPNTPAEARRRTRNAEGIPNPTVSKDLVAAQPHTM